MRQESPGIPTRWMFNNAAVMLSQAAQIAPTFQPYGSHEGLVQDALAEWDLTSGAPIQTIELPGVSLIPMTVKVGREDGVLPDVEWGVHVSHPPTTPASPFMAISGRHAMGAIQTDLVTIGFDPEASVPTITLAYPGSYAPPLPWSPDAELAVGGREACIEYWRTHAFVITPATRVMRRGSTPRCVPFWWL